MKNLVILIALFAAFSCDYVESPLGDAIIVDPSCVEPTFAPNTNTKRNVIIEDFTGFRCNNCPAAAYQIDTIKGNIGKQIIPVAVHVVDQFAAPDPSKAPKYQTDFRTPGGTDIWTAYGGVIGLPSIMINRIDTFNNPARFQINYLSPFNEQVRKLIDDVPDVNIQVKANYIASKSLVCAYAETEVLSTLADDHSIVFMLLEDSIIDWQLYSGAGGYPFYSAGDIPDYIHKHVLRKSMNNYLGETIITGGSNAVGDKAIWPSSYIVTESSWDPTHFEVVAFVYNNRTKEIMQAYKANVE